MDFSIKNFAVVNLWGIDIWITETIVSTWIIMAALVLFALFVRIRLNKFEEIPKGFQNIIEVLVDTFDGFVRGAAGEKLMVAGNWFFTVFVFVLASNLSGLFGLRPPTADWSTTAMLSIVTFALIQLAAFSQKKGKYLKEFFEPNPVFFPLNIIGELARPIALSFRLFGNILAGMILMTIYYSLTPIYLQFGIPAALHSFFDVFTGLLQTYIFCTLSLTFIGVSAASEESIQHG